MKYSKLMDELNSVEDKSVVVCVWEQDGDRYPLNNVHTDANGVNIGVGSNNELSVQELIDLLEPFGDVMSEDASVSCYGFPINLVDHSISDCVDLNI